MYRAKDYTIIDSNSYGMIFFSADVVISARKGGNRSDRIALIAYPALAILFNVVYIIYYSVVTAYDFPEDGRARFWEK